MLQREATDISPTDGVLISIRGLSHRYTEEWAIRNIDLEIASAGIVGLLGANGAGKSTMMNIVCGVLYQTEGTVLIDGLDIRGDALAARQRIGFLPQQAPLYRELTVDEYLNHSAGLRNVADEDINDSVSRVKERCGLSHIGRRLIGNLSGGYRQRVGIAQAIIHNPKVVVLDEPTNGLDPNQIIEVKKLIKGIGEDRLVLLSSHILSDVQALCSRIVMIDQGEIVFDDSMAAFNTYTEPHAITVRFGNPPDAGALLAVEGISGGEYTAEGFVTLSFDGGQVVAERVVAASVAGGWQLREIGFERSSLEQTFARLSIERSAGQSVEAGVNRGARS